MGRVLFVFSLLLPALFLMHLVMSNYSKESKKNIFRTKTSQAQLGATVVEEKLNAYIELGLSYVKRPLLIQYIKENRWNEVIDLLKEVLGEKSGFDRIVLYDTNANIKGEMPNAFVTGQSRADKEWFKEFRKKWAPFVSGVYNRNAVPRKNVVCIVIPIIANASSSELSKKTSQTPLEKIGILQLQLDLDVFHTWANIDVGQAGIIYIVDQYGRIVHHPKFPGHLEIVDFSSVGIVKELLAGKDSVVRNYNEVEKENRIAAYQHVPGYGWGIVVTQPIKSAFRERNATLRTLIIICFLVLGLAIALGYTFYQMILFQQRSGELLNLKNRELEKTNTDLKDALDNIKTLKGMLPICAHCKRIRDDSGYWQQIEAYVKDHSDAEFSHGICPECVKKYYPVINKKISRVSHTHF
jgi:hypothetical protein